MDRQRWTVSVSDDVFDELDRRLGAEREPNGEPSVNDFLTIDLLPIVDGSGPSSSSSRTSIVELIPGRPEYRILITAGLLVPRFAVTGQLASDGAVSFRFAPAMVQPNGIPERSVRIDSFFPSPARSPAC